MIILAELKRNDEYYFDNALPNLTPQVKNEPKPHLIPQKKANRISLLEKVVIGFVLTLVVALAFGMIHMRNEITKVQENTTKIEQSISTKEKNIQQLQQEKTELSSAENIKQAAEKLGLTLQEDNIRNVK